jgi:hypothetical protein
MQGLITISQLCAGTDLSKYRIRYFQRNGFFEEEEGFALVRSRCKGCVYDPRWIEVWREAQQYMKAGLRELEALEEATGDIIYSRDY